MKMISPRLVPVIYLLAQVDPMATATERPAGKVFNGTLASILDFPHQAFLQVMGAMKAEGSPISIVSFACAVLINSYWLLTAAHVMLNKEKRTGGAPLYKIILGVDDLTQTGIVADVELYRCHPGYSNYRRRMNKDICLVKTRQMIQSTERVRPVALPVKDEEKSYRITDEILTSGFGQTFDPEDNFEYLRLRRVRMIIYPGALCYREEFRRASLICAVRWFKVSDPLIRPPGSAGKGDSGTGLVARRNSTGELVLLGILSFSMKPLDEDPNKRNESLATDHYTAVSYYLDWISENMC